jgi:hypothetical protein
MKNTVISFMRVVFGVLTILVVTVAQATPDGAFVTVTGDIAYGPGVVSVHNTAFGGGTTYTNGSPNALFYLANDGRFKYGAAVGYVSDNIGISLKYHDLGSQHLMGVNGPSLPERDSGEYKASYYGLHATKFFPTNDKKDDFLISLGGGKQKTELAVNSAEFVGATNKRVTQNETVLFWGVGMRHHINSTLSIDVEYGRLTPMTHGLLHRGVYNNSFSILSVGLTIYI